VVLGVLGTTARLDAPDDGSLLRLNRSTWQPSGVVVDVPAPLGTSLRTGDLVTGIAGHDLAAGLGGVPRPQIGAVVPYEVMRDIATSLAVTITRPDPYPLLAQGWGNLVFVVALAALALALYARRPEEPATAPLLVLAAGLLGSTFVVVAGLPALAIATGGPQVWLFNLNAVGAYSIAWGATLAFSLLLTPAHPWRRGRHAIAVAYGAPLTVMVLWAATAGLVAHDSLEWLGLVHTGQTAVVVATLLVTIASGAVSYRAAADAATRARLRWLAGGAALAGVLGIAGWLLPELITGSSVLPWGALGLSALPFVAGIAVALRRHQLFDIERLANRSLVYAFTIAALAAAYAAVVAFAVSVLQLSTTPAATLAAVGAALALAPLRTAAQGAVNRVMYGDRQEPVAALARLGDRLQTVLVPDDVMPAVVDSVASSLRLPYAAIELADGAGGYEPGAVHGAPVGAVHAEALRHQGEVVGRLLVSGRGREDPLDPLDLRLIASLAQQAGPAVQAVRLQADLVRSRSQVVASREDERRRLRRDLHDGLGPTLAAIGLKAGLAARQVPAHSHAHVLLGEITAEAKASLADVRRLVEALRPPALDELGLVGAVRSRAASLAGEMSIEVTGPSNEGPLPAAVETAAYRIAVEAMTNAVRHSGASVCRVTITATSGALDLTVRDDGRGLDPSCAPGVGLRSMRERVEELGGTFAVLSPSGGGTLVHARLPMPDLGGSGDPADPRG
jgi:signal transduction histidine kinase